MRLLDLEPSWVEHNGSKVAIIFRCPCCIGKPSKTKRWLTCFFVNAGSLPWDLLDNIKGHDEVHGCNPESAWSRTTDDFATMTISPSIDVSKAWHWHGYIRSGIITG